MQVPPRAGALVGPGVETEDTFQTLRQLPGGLRSVGRVFREARHHERVELGRNRHSTRLEGGAGSVCA